MSKYNQYNLYFNIIKKYKSTLIILFFLSLFYPIRSVVFPRIILAILNSINRKIVWWSLSLFLSIFVFVYLCNGLYEIVLVKLVKSNIKSDILNYFYRKLFKGLEKNYSEIPTPNIFSNVFYVGTVGNVIFSYFFSTIFPYIITFIGVTIYFIIQGYYNIGISFLIINVLLLLFPILFNKYLKKNVVNLIGFRNDLEKNIYDIFWNIYNILSLDNRDKELKNIDKMTTNLKEYSKIMWDTNLINIMSGRIIMIVYICLVIYYFFNNYKNHHISKKELINLVLVVIFATYEFFWSYYIYNGLIIELLEQDQIIKEIEKTLSKKTIKKLKPINKSFHKYIELKNISFDYLNKNKIFNKLNIQFDKGKTYAIVGNIGSGKSSLLKILFGIYYPDNGDIIIDNKIHRNTTRNINWRKYFNYLQQSPVLFGRSLEENIYYNNNKEETDKIILKLGLNIIIDKIKKERKSQVLEKLGEGLSGGQKQIINLLRIISNPKDIILMDEPTSSLDKNTKKIFYKMFKHLKQLNKTVLIVTHDIELEKLCDKTINISKIQNN